MQDCSTTDGASYVYTDYLDPLFGGYTNGYISVLFVYTVVSYIIFVSLLFPLTIPVIENSQIDAIMCVLSCETKWNFS